MKKLTMILAIITFSYLSKGQEISGMSLDLSDLEGKWFINYSNFPMWLKGNKTSPTFNYTSAEKRGQKLLLDRVEFVKNGKVKSINGKDKALNENNTRFIWRGNGLMSMIKSKWEVVHLDKVNNWAIIYFEKTLFTPNGYDVISSKPEVNDKLKSIIQKTLKGFNIEDKLEEICQE